MHWDLLLVLLVVVGVFSPVSSQRIALGIFSDSSCTNITSSTVLSTGSSTRSTGTCVQASSITPAGFQLVQCASDCQQCLTALAVSYGQCLQLTAGAWFSSSLVLPTSFYSVFFGDPACSAPLSWTLHGWPGSSVTLQSGVCTFVSFSNSFIRLTSTSSSLFVSSGCSNDCSTCSQTAVTTTGSCLALEARLFAAFSVSRANISAAMVNKPNPLTPACFPASSHAASPKGAISLGNLKLGDDVAVDNLGRTEKIVAFLHRDPSVVADFLKIEYAYGPNETRSLSMTADHLVFVRDFPAADVRALPAGSLLVGQLLVLSENIHLSLGTIVSVTRFSGTGVYAPLTASGTLIVDGVLVSCYAYVPHHLAQLAMTPLRLGWLSLDLNHAGLHPYAAFLMNFFRFSEVAARLGYAAPSSAIPF